MQQSGATELNRRRHLSYARAVILLSLFATQSSVAQTRKSDREFHQLYGAVKIVQTETAKLKGKAGKLVEGDRVLVTVEKYDRNGDLIESIFYHLGRPASRTVYNYDRRGDREGRVYFPNLPGGVVVGQGVNVNADGSLSQRSKFKYDGEGRRIEETQYSSEDQPEFRQLITYDASGRRQTVEAFEGKTLKYKSVSSYDSQGRLNERSKYDGKGRLTKKESFLEFDAHGNWTKSQAEKPANKNGKPDFVPDEVMHRTIAYY